MINQDEKKLLLELMQREADAKSDLSDALAAVANKHNVATATLKKFITAIFKDATAELKNSAESLLDLLDGE